MSRRDTSSRLVPLDSLLATIRGWRSRGARPVVALGAFDLPHADHARRLAAARARGDRLAVVVEDDAWAAAELGAGAPVSPAADRARVMAALRGVDAAAIAGAADLTRLEEALRPDQGLERFDEVDRRHRRRLRGESG